MNRDPQGEAGAERLARFFPPPAGAPQTWGSAVASGEAHRGPLPGEVRLDRRGLTRVDTVGLGLRCARRKVGRLRGLDVGALRDGVVRRRLRDSRS